MRLSLRDSEAAHAAASTPAAAAQHAGHAASEVP
jgi:hypothetical protein